MKRTLIYTILLLTIAAQSAWAHMNNYYPDTSEKNKTHGPWTFEEADCKYSGRFSGSSIRYVDMNHTSWSKAGGAQHAASLFNDDDGMGFTMHLISEWIARMTVMSIYSHHEEVPAYTRKRLTWDYQLRGKADRWCQSVTLYGCTDLNTLKNARVNATYELATSSPYLIVDLKHEVSTSQKDVNTIFDFDNRKGTELQTKSYYLMMTEIIEDRTEFPLKTFPCNYWGAFKQTSEPAWTCDYYKYITFHANGSHVTGTMEEQEIENSAALTANAFVRTGYTFAGWATAPNGSMVYNDEHVINAAENDKGHRDLYAVWTNPTYEGVIADIEAIGSPVTLESNDAIHYARIGYNALNDEGKQQVTNYSTLTDAEAAYNVVSLIHAIGDVEYTQASKAKIDAARAAYDALNETRKALLAEEDVNILLAAESAYQVLDVIAKIEAIDTVEYTAECKARIDAARAAYDALNDAQKETLSAMYLEILQDAEAAYAAFRQTSINHVGKDATPVTNQSKDIYYPALPDGTSQWQTVEKDASDKTIVIKAKK